MNLIKKMSVILAATSLVLMLGACSKKEVNDINNLNVNYDSTKEVDEVIFNSSVTGEAKMSPMHDDKKVTEGYTINFATDYATDIDLSVKVMDEGKIIYEDIVNFDLVEGEKVEVRIIDDSNGDLKTEVVTK